jgi:hypothetical protein
MYSHPRNRCGERADAACIGMRLSLGSTVGRATRVLVRTVRVGLRTRREALGSGSVAGLHMRLWGATPGVLDKGGSGIFCWAREKIRGVRKVIVTSV